MEKHKCKLCNRSFVNGRALGGHMKAHLTRQQQQQQQLSDCDQTEFDESDSSGLLLGVYGLRENPKKSLRFADPEFAFGVDNDNHDNNNNNNSGGLVQDRESETESRNPSTRRRSKRNKRSDFGDTQKQNFGSKYFNNCVVDQEQMSSSVSDAAACIEEDVAMSLVMLSQDSWEPKRKVKEVGADTERKVSKCRGKFRCEKCTKLFRSSQALGNHRRVCSVTGIGSMEAKVVSKGGGGGDDVDGRIFECPYCFKVFGSGQALGGHKRSHLMMISSNNSATDQNSAKISSSTNLIIDLNLPAPLEDDDFSVVSDA